MHNVFLFCLMVLVFAACTSGSSETNERAREVSPQEVCAEAAYPAAADSAYILPYPPGQNYLLGQGNCTDGSHSEEQGYAFDFDMPIGSEITAVRAGVVVDVEEQFEDGNRDPDGANFIFIEHEDGTLAGYFHLTQNGALVEVDQQIQQGQLIARSGDTGDSTEPHLHLEVLSCIDCDDTVPISFKNSIPAADVLLEGQQYTAGEL